MNELRIRAITEQQNIPGRRSKWVYLWPYVQPPMAFPPYHKNHMECRNGRLAECLVGQRAACIIELGRASLLCLRSSGTQKARNDGKRDGFKPFKSPAAPVTHRAHRSAIRDPPPFPRQGVRQRSRRSPGDQRGAPPRYEPRHRLLLWATANRAPPLGRRRPESRTLKRAGRPWPARH